MQTGDGDGERTSTPAAAHRLGLAAPVESFAAGRLSQAAFCRREGLALSTFGYWKRRLAASGEGAASCSEPAVIDLGTLDDRLAGWDVKIALGVGVPLALRRR